MDNTGDFYSLNVGSIPASRTSLCNGGREAQCKGLQIPKTACSNHARCSKLNTIMKILCTGNPDSTSKQTIANGVRQVFPEADFAHPGTGYDLQFTTPESINFFKNQIIKYDVFLNCSYIKQCDQLMFAYHSFLHCKKPNYVINIGSSIEYEGVHTKHWQYRLDKLTLRDTSMEICSPEFSSTSLTCYGINDGIKHPAGLNVLHIAQTMKWILEQEFVVPIISMRAD